MECQLLDRNELKVETDCILNLNPDIVLLVETKLQGTNVINLNGYIWYGQNRTRIKQSAKSGSGGVGILIKENFTLY